MVYRTGGGRPMTLREYARMPDTLQRVDLVRGMAVSEPPPGGEHGSLQAAVASALYAHARANGLGRVLVESAFVLSKEPPTVRGPDVAFVARGRYADDVVPAGMTPFAPDLAVEIVSLAERAADLHEKVCDYLAAGTRVVWVVHPRPRELLVFHADGSVVRHGRDGTVTDDDVLHGFAMPVGDLLGL